MSSILIITDQLKYGNSNGIIATPSLSVRSIFAGDLIKNKLTPMQAIRGYRFDTVLVPETITEESSDYEKIQAALKEITIYNRDVKIHSYANQY